MTLILRAGFPQPADYPALALHVAVGFDNDLTGNRLMNR